MSETKDSAAHIVERLSSSYGVTSQRALASCLDVPSNNVSAWVQRKSVPGNAIIKCALDTGADLKWLVTGEFAFAKNESLKITKKDTSSSGHVLLKKMLSSGGRAVLSRIIEAYGFRTQKELGEHLNISSGTISTWVRREYFPGDVVIACALDTGSSLHWLATGEDRLPKLKENNYSADIVLVPCFTIASGSLKENGHSVFDQKFLGFDNEDIKYIEKENNSWFVDFSVKKFVNGKYLVNIDNIYEVYDVSRIPANKVLLRHGDVKIECKIDEIECVGEVFKTILRD
jgi:transcriptional regulator with XRE-family HTH domain